MKAIERLKQLRQKRLMEAVNTLTDMAMENRKLLHILVNVAPHLEKVTITVYHPNLEWLYNHLTQPLLLVSTDLSEENALLKLLEIEDQIIDLVVDAKEQEEEAL